VCVVVYVYVFVYTFFVKVGMKSVYICGHVWKEITALAISNSFCFVIQQRFGMHVGCLHLLTHTHTHTHTQTHNLLHPHLFFSLWL